MRQLIIVLTFTLLGVSAIFGQLALKNTSDSGIVLELATPTRIGIGYNFFDSTLNGGTPMGWGRGAIITYDMIGSTALVVKPFAYFFAGQAAPYVGASIVAGSDFSARHFVNIVPELGFSFAGMLMFYYALQFPVYPAGGTANGEAGIRMYFFPLFTGQAK